MGPHALDTAVVCIIVEFEGDGAIFPDFAHQACSHVDGVALCDPQNKQPEGFNLAV